MQQHMNGLTKQQFFPRTSLTGLICIPLRLTAIVVSLLLTTMPFLTGCGGGGEAGGGAGATASLAWSPVQDSSVYAYFVHYGQQSPGQPGSCAYESSMYVASPSATIINLDANTLYYFTVSAYNGLESACSNEISAVTSPPSVQTDQRNGPPSVQTDQRSGPPSVQTDQRSGPPSVQN
jgi:hypothetical protein